MDPALLVVTGLQKEAKAAKGPGIATLCSGGDSERLRALLRKADPTAYWGVVSFGIAGGLDPSLVPGDILLGTAVRFGDERRLADESLSTALAASLRRRTGAAGRAEFAGSDSAVIRIEDKASLRAATGASAVDMESHVVAAWAALHGLPFAILRVVSDPAHRALPALAAQALKPDGRIDLRRVMMGVARTPGQIPALAGAGRDSRAAFEALGRCRGLLGPFLRFGFADL